jgi:hypothetical protein
VTGRLEMAADRLVAVAGEINGGLAVQTIQQVLV